MSDSLEKFRPRSLDDIVGQSESVAILKRLVAKAKDGGFFPNLLFAGSPGTGKTTASLAIANELLGDYASENFREINSSDERGIDVVRDDIAKWVTNMHSREVPFRVLALEECDGLTPDAQAGLRRIMESATETRFIMTCNKPAKVIDAIRSRCLTLNFKPLTNADLTGLLTRVAASEGVPVEQTRLQSAIKHSRGDARRAIHLFVDGQTDGDRFLRLDLAIETMLRGQGGPLARVESFVGFLRQEGFDGEWESVCEAIGDRVYEDKLYSDPVKANWIDGLAVAAYRAAQAQLPLFQIRGVLHALMNQ